MQRGGALVHLDANDTTDRRRRKLFRRRLTDGWLAVIAAGPTLAIAVADDIELGAVAGVVRHLTERHAITDGVTICRAPACDAVRTWRPAADDALGDCTASSA